MSLILIVEYFRVVSEYKSTNSYTEVTIRTDITSRVQNYIDNVPNCSTSVIICQSANKESYPND